MQRAIADYGPFGKLPEEEIVEALQKQKDNLEYEKEIERRRSAALTQAANLRRDIEKLGAKPVK